MTEPRDKSDKPNAEQTADAAELSGQLYLVSAMCPDSGTVRFDPPFRVESVPEQREDGAR